MDVVALNNRERERRRQPGRNVVTNQHSSYTDAVIQKYDLEARWSPQVIAEAKTLARPASEQFQRQCLDFTGLPFVTIDGYDARDYDDAICARSTDDGWLLQIAIADVSHYVRPGTVLDKVARSRGNSAYFADRVIPMLPEVLSNDLCSLRPDEDRLAIICSITINSAGEILKWTFDQAWIRSRLRLTYDEVHQYLEKRTERFNPDWGKAVCESLDVASEIVRARQGRCTGKSRIDIDFPETELALGDNGAVEAIGYRESNSATRLIEECMLAANLCAAQTLAKSMDRAVYRVHHAPSPQDLIHLRQVLQHFGLALAGGQAPKILDFNETLSVARETLGHAQWVEGLVLRTLKQARYDSAVGPHFALGFDCYTHFTSPIRRYPDLVVHRLIKNILGYDRSTRVDTTDEQLADLGVHCSMAERRAERAERAVSACYKAQFMSDKIGQVFRGSISGVTEFGVFVQLLDQPIDGLVHVTQLERDYYVFNPQAMELLGKHTGRTLRLGDTIEVRLTGTSPEEGKINFSCIMNNHSTPRGRTYRRNKKAHRGR